MTIAAMFPVGFSTASPPPILRAGHPVLVSQAAPVIDLADPAVHRAIAAMQAALASRNGVGLAAPQIAVPLRIILFKAPASRLTGLPGDEACDDTILINPAIEPLGPERDGGWEGCLSLPGLRGWVPRWRRIRYTGLTLAGDRIDRQAAGFHARVVQHECDHLEGRLYLHRMDDFSHFGFVDEMIAAERPPAEAG